MKISGMVGAIDRVGAEQPAEEQDLGEQEDPHAQLAGVELLPVGGEMMGQKCAGARPCGSDGGMALSWRTFVHVVACDRT